MSRSLPLAFSLASLAFAGCAANGEPPSAQGTPSGAGAATTAGPNGAPLVGAPPATAAALLDARDVGILTLEQSPSALKLLAQNRRPRASFGPSAGWNGAGRPTHRWTLFGAGGAVLGSGDITVHKALEAPPNPSKGAPGQVVEPDVFSFVVRVPVPAPGESVEIVSLATPSLSVRWP